MKRSLFVVLAVAVLLHQGVAPAGAQPDALKFFKNYIVTGDYVVAGVGLRGKGIGGIAKGQLGIGQRWDRAVGGWVEDPSTKVPDEADIVAAFLYWQVVTKDTLGPGSGIAGARFNGYPLSTAAGSTARVLDLAGTAPCWSSGGGTGASGGTHRTYSFRQDVLSRFETDPVTGKLKVNGVHDVWVPDSGSSGNGVPIALGASLVIVYRDSLSPLGAVVLYDDGFTIDNANRAMSQTIKGFYDAASTRAPTQNAKISYIVGSGQPNKDESVYLNETLLGASPFDASEGLSWDNQTYWFSVPSASSSVVTSISTGGGGDCLTPAAIVFRTVVRDTDADGLLDVWETATQSAPVRDPFDRLLPPLGSMGADPYRKDLFVEINYMDTGGLALKYGDETKPPHSHRPGHKALKMVGDAFDNAKVNNVYQLPGNVTESRAPGIKVHFDVGPDYPPCAPDSGCADDYIIGRRGESPDLARGGDAIHERETVCAPRPGDPAWVCRYSGHPGTVGWKTGLRMYRDQVLSGPGGAEIDRPAPGQVGDCDAPGNECVRRFDENRRHMFRFVLFGHALGIPKSELACLDVDGRSVPGDAYGKCASPLVRNPEYFTPRTTSGVAEYPGRDVLVTLGGFKDVNDLPVGTPQVQASTLMHELGHLFERRHGGDAADVNGKPTYLSVMNYLYQLRLLLNDDGTAAIDYSYGTSDLLAESDALSDGPLLNLPPYRIAWYAPLEGSFLEGQPGIEASIAKRYLDGRVLPLPCLTSAGLEAPAGPGGSCADPLRPNPAYPGAWVRLQASRKAEPIDWFGNGDAANSRLPDLNFNNVTGEALDDSNDWGNLRLNQIGAGRNVGGTFLDKNGTTVRLGPLSADTGLWDYGLWDYGLWDYGLWDYGLWDYGLWDYGLWDYGLWDYGLWDYGSGDLGLGDQGASQLGRPALGSGDDGRGYLGDGDFEQEITAEHARELANVPPNLFKACVIGGHGVCDGDKPHDVRLSWAFPHVGNVRYFEVFRVKGEKLAPEQVWTSVGRWNFAPGVEAYTQIDANSDVLDPGKAYTYFAIAVYNDDAGRPDIRSLPSDQATIWAMNDAPEIDPDPILNPAAFYVGGSRSIDITVGDVETAVENLWVTATSGNASVASVTVTGTGASRTVLVQGLKPGIAEITVTVFDRTGCPVVWPLDTPATACPPGGSPSQSASSTFTVEVMPSSRFVFTGFLTPLAPLGTETSPSYSGTFNYGRALALKWKLTLGGQVVTTDQLLPGGLVAKPGTWNSTSSSCALTPAVPAPTLVLFGADGRPTGNSTYRFDPTNQQFIFNWDTSAVNKAYCYRVVLSLNDGTAPRATVVRFR